jgi:tungstate transport system ATP-binding protein
MMETGSILPLQLEHVNFTVAGRAILQDLNLRLGAGTRTIILGPNGAGKSVLMRVCHGLLRPTSGAVRWLGPLRDEAAAHQAMVFQRPVMLRTSARANIEYALSVRGVNAAERKLRAQQALEYVGLTALADRAARVLSGGEQQRLALARAWSLRPAVLFLDEPTANLDPSASTEVERIVQVIHDAGTKIVMCTHNLGQARRLADEILFLHQGRLLEQTPVADFFHRPQSNEADAFIKGELPWN